MTAADCFIGVDVGTGSVRVALINRQGDVLADAMEDIMTWRDELNVNIQEQSSTQIWDAISRACRATLASSGVHRDRVKGISFDATCSLVVTSEDGTPLSVSPGSCKSDESYRNIVVWSDHRGHKEAAKINAAVSEAFDFRGEAVDIELELPKVLWLQEHMPKEQFRGCRLYDLPSYLAFRATSDPSSPGKATTVLRSASCSGQDFDNVDLPILVSFLNQFPAGFRLSKMHLYQIFHHQVASNQRLPFPASCTDQWADWYTYSPVSSSGRSADASKSGTVTFGTHAPLVYTPGQPISQGLSKEAAKNLGLNVGTAVGEGVIDGYAGWLGTIAASSTFAPPINLESNAERLAVIAGTSTCFILQSAKPVIVPGLWGPCLHAIVPGHWMAEGGQSATGQLLDFFVETHPAGSQLRQQADTEGKHHFQYLNDYLDRLCRAEEAPYLTYLTRHLHVYPDLHGNRSPLSDASIRGMISGLTLDRSLHNLALQYLAVCESLALQTRHVVQVMNERGHRITQLSMSGGLVKNKLLVQLLADVCDMPIQLPFSHKNSVVLGSAILASVAAEESKQGPISNQAEACRRAVEMAPRLWETMGQMSRAGELQLPQAGAQERKLLDAKFDIFKSMIDHQQGYRKRVEEALR